VAVLGNPAWASESRFASLASRLANQDELDVLLSSASASFNGFELMQRLQQRGVPAGVCQTAEDRCQTDPQLAHLQWLVELEQTEIGRWPVKEHPARLSETPAYIGGRFNRSGPNYGEDNDYVLGSILDLAPSDIAELRESGVL
jgi:crotonobetainyl-CoA:carnitine CoA-transferase CaiB-like acyl-CoA transferase